MKRTEKEALESTKRSRSQKGSVTGEQQEQSSLFLRSLILSVSRPLHSNQARPLSLRIGCTDLMPIPLNIYSVSSQSRPLCLYNVKSLSLSGIQVRQAGRPGHGRPSITLPSICISPQLYFAIQFQPPSPLLCFVASFIQSSLTSARLAGSATATSCRLPPIRHYHRYGLLFGPIVLLLLA